MVLRRRGRRKKTSGVSCVAFSSYPDCEAALFALIRQLQKPTADIPPSAASYRKLYDSLTEAQQKNLIDKAANQILYAHPDIVAETLKKLRRISPDLGQKTEVSFRKQLLSR